MFKYKVEKYSRCFSSEFLFTEVFPSSWNIPWWIFCPTVCLHIIFGIYTFNKNVYASILLLGQMNAFSYACILWHWCHNMNWFKSFYLATIYHGGLLLQIYGMFVFISSFWFTSPIDNFSINIITQPNGMHFWKILNGCVVEKNYWSLSMKQKNTLVDCLL